MDSLSQGESQSQTTGSSPTGVILVPDDPQSDATHQVACAIAGSDWKKELDELKEQMKRERDERQQERKELEAKLEEAVAALMGIGQTRNLLTENAVKEETAPEQQDELVQFVDNKEVEGGQGMNMDDEWHAPFGESTYTLLFMCAFWSQGFAYGIFIYALQIVTTVLTMAGVVDLHSEGNPLMIPPMVNLTVTIAQGVTLFMALAYQSDLVEAVLKLQDGFYPEVLEKHPGATFPTWLISCLAQLVAGMLLLATIFILTMQVDNVLAMMLNFAALHFMSEIDDLGFNIAKQGFVTNQLQEEVHSVVDFKVPKRSTRNVYRQILYVVTLIGLFVGYAILKRQLDGYYLPTYVYVQFGDAYNPKIPYYSGILKSESVRTVGYKAYRDMGTDNFVLSYCKEERSWTFSDMGDPCDFFAKSFETSSYDVSTIPNSNWQILDTFHRLKPFDSFSLVSRDCDIGTCQGTCGSDGLCHCRLGQFGIDCEFANVCEELVVDPRFHSFPAWMSSDLIVDYWFDDDSFVDRHLHNWTEQAEYAVSDEFHLLKNRDTEKHVSVYNMPVYYSNKTYPANIIFFEAAVGYSQVNGTFSILLKQNWRALHPISSQP